MRTNNTPNKQPTVVFLLSEKSSGSTAFQYEILRHPQVNHVKHTLHNDFETLYWIKASCILDIPPSEYAQGKLFYRPWIARKSLEAFLNKNLPDFAPPRDNEELVFTGWDAIAHKYGALLFEKSPHHLNHWAALSVILRYIEYTDIRVRFIGLIRNPLAVTYSAWTRWGSPPTTRQFMWAQSYRNLLCFKELVSANDFLLIKYQNLVTNPKKTMLRVCQFLNIDYIDTMGRGLHRKSVDKWLSDQSFLFHLDSSVKRVAATFGYNNDELTNNAAISSYNAQKFLLKSKRIRLRAIANRLINRNIIHFLRLMRW